jgi:hypothetical protein
MVGSEELMCALITFGRGNVQDLVARSRDISDTRTYLLAELHFELARVTSFKTMDLVNFERRKVFRYSCEGNESPYDPQ